MEENLILHDGHRERLRQRILNADPESLEPHELLEFLLYFALPRQDVNALTHALLDEYGSLKAMLAADDAELSVFLDMGMQAVEWLRLLLRYADMATVCNRNSRRLVNFADVFNYARYLQKRHELPCCIQLCTDEEDCLIYKSIVCRKRRWGTPDVMYEALADAVACNARHAYLLVLTTEYMPMPGRYDRDEVIGYSKLLDIIGCELMDVVMLGKIGITSMRRMDLIPEPKYIRKAKSLREDYMRGMPTAEDLAGPNSPFHTTGGQYERPEPV